MNYPGKGRDRSGKNSICKGPKVGRSLTKGLCDGRRGQGSVAGDERGTVVRSFRDLQTKVRTSVFILEAIGGSEFSVAVER